MTTLAPIMHGFFTNNHTERRTSAHAVAAYRDAFRLLLHHAQCPLSKTLSTLTSPASTARSSVASSTTSKPNAATA